VCPRRSRFLPCRTDRGKTEGQTRSFQPSTQPSVAKTDSAKKADKPAEDVSITVLPLEDLKDGEKEPAPKEEVKEDSEKSEK